MEYSRSGGGSPSEKEWRPNMYSKFLLGFQKNKFWEPQLHIEMGFKMAPLVDFAFKTELQCLPGHHVNFRKQTYGDCGFVFDFDYNKYLLQKYKSQSMELDG